MHTVYCKFKFFFQEEKRVIERKRNILYLIANYLHDNGFRLSSDCIIEEGQLTDAYQVCDNIDLDTILQEYESYYFLKYQKQPRIVKKIKKEVITPAPDKIKKLKKNTESNNPIKNIEKIDKTKNIQVQVTSLSTPSTSGENPSTHPDAISSCITLENYSERKHIRPLRDFPGYTSDWREMAEVISRDIITKDLNVRWDDIKGHEKAKSILIESVIYPFRYPQLYRGLLAPWRGILLHGPPGTGKTLLAKAVATQSKVVFFNVSASCLISKWRGDSEKLVRVLFDLARHNAPSVIYLDEVEALTSHRDSPSEHEASRRFKSELLRQLDGIQESKSDQVLLLATTNLPWQLDSAMLRRLEKRIHIDLPNEKSRSMIITQLLPFSTRWNLSEMKEILDKTVGYSGADIHLICKEAAMSLLRETVQKIEQNTKASNTSTDSVDLSEITAKQFLEVIARTQPTAIHLAQKHRKWAAQFGST